VLTAALRMHRDYIIEQKNEKKAENYADLGQTILYISYYCYLHYSKMLSTQKGLHVR
jgi:hypothetical protein